MILKLIGMIILGLLSALLSYYKKNYYVKVFDDILGKEEEEKAETRVGRGFLYGFFFPIFFVLLLTGLVALVAFLIVAGIIAAIVFVIVWVTEKILPCEWLGGIVRSLFGKIGIKGPAVEVESNPAAESGSD
jgi:predicted histidine transporter YuiF (NhaC family)